MSSTTPVELAAVGTIPARDGRLFTGVAPSVVEVFPGILLIASIVRTKNQCILELVQPTGAPNAAAATTVKAELSSSGNTGSASDTSFVCSTSSPPLVQRRLSEQGGVSRKKPNFSSVVVPMALKSGFRVPRVIQLIAEDEGVIETVCLVREPLGTAFVAALEEQDRAASKNPLRDGNFTATTSTAGGAAVTSASTGASPPIQSVNHVHVHFFIGTSNGTVVVGNALRGTILAIAQFQYHHAFSSESRGSRSSTTSVSPTTGEADSGETGSRGNENKAAAKNQAVVKFVVRSKREEQLWNPSLPLSQETGLFPPLSTAAASSRKITTSTVGTATSPTVGSRVASVYVVHSGGKVVELTRAALDVFVRCSVDRLDGRRPHLFLEWEPATSPSSFPIAGPACDFAAHVSGVYVLEPPSAYSTLEKRTATTKAASPESTRFAVRDADVVTEMPEPASTGSSSALLAPLIAQRRPCEALLVGGNSPLFSFYRLQPPASGFSASNAVKAVKSMVTGVARTLWFSALGSSSPAERPPHLKKVGASAGRPFYQADAKCAALQVDPSQQWAAFAVEGGGRIYVAELQTGVVSCVLKSCRAAQFTWWWTETAVGGLALLLVVYLPLRRAVEVYMPRTWERLAACHVPDGCVLLRTCGVPSEQRRVADSDSGRHTTSVCSGCGSAALLLDPAGTIYKVRVGWTLRSPAGSTVGLVSGSPLCAGAMPNPGNAEKALLNASVLRGCQTPDDFLELALQLPLPEPHVVWDDGTVPAESGKASAVKSYAVRGGDEVRRYTKSLELLANTLQRRFAPGYAEIVVTPPPCGPQQLLDGSRASVPHNTTAAQCLHYVRVYRSLTENYYRLLSCRRVAPSRYFDPTQWTSGLVTPELWKVNFSTAVATGGAAPATSATITFVRQMEAYTTSLLSAFPNEQGIFSTSFAGYLNQVLRKVPIAAASETATTCALADPVSVMPLSTFLHCFYCGTARPSFLSDAIAVAEDADGSVNFLGPLSDLVFGQLGLDGFFAQLPALTELGFTTQDVALLTVTWVARQGGRHLSALFATTTVGLLAATLLTFSDGHFLSALDRTPIPFISVKGDMATSTAVDSITALLWCCAVRCALRPNAALVEGQRLTRRVRQLLQLWCALAKSKDGRSPAAATVTAQASEQSCSGPGPDSRIAFSLRLGSVEPPSLSLSLSTTVSNGVAGISRTPARSGGGSTRIVGGTPCEGDAFEVYLQRNGISVSLLDDFTVPRDDASADAVRDLPLFSTFVSSIGATEHVRSRGSSGVCDSPDVVESLPWIEGRQWDQERFRSEVTKPLEKLWQQLTSSSPGAKPGGTRSLKAALRGGGRGLTDKEGRSSVYTSSLLLVAMSVLDHAIRPLTDVSFFFWDNSAVPDGNFFPISGSPEGLLLSGSRTSRDYLKSLQKLASLVETMLQQAVTPLENADHVVLIQKISMALTEDDALLFPLVPNFLRARLTVWMQVLAQAPHAPLRRVQRVGRLVSLLLFFSEASALTMGGVALTQLQSQLSVPWADLIGGTNRREQLRLLPDVLVTDVCASSVAGAASPSLPIHAAEVALSSYAMEEDNPNTAPLHVGVAAAVLRRFLAAGAVLYAQQHGQLMVTSAFPPAPCMGVVADDTRRCLSRLAVCLGVNEVMSDIADVVLMDYEIKHLFPVASVEQEMLLLSTKAAASQIGVSVLQCYLVQILQYVTTQRKTYGQRGDRAAFEIASENLRTLVEALSPECRAWLQQRETEMMTAANAAVAEEGRKASISSSTASSLLNAPPRVAAMTDLSMPFLCDAGWVTVAEYQDMRRLVFSTLELPKGTPDRKNFYQVLFTLSQWACEGRLKLPASLQRIARELPAIVEKWEKVA
jgi:hypothetical protein